MAYNSKDEERNIVGTIDKGQSGNQIVITKIKNTKTEKESIDVRLFYKDEAGELRPTSKGVRFSTEATVDFVKAIISTLTDEELTSIGLTK